MKLSDIFNDKDMSATDKVAKIAKVVTKAREAYGNTDANITAPEIHTVNGLEDLKMLSAESKIAVAESEVQNIKTVSYEYTKSFEGASLNKKIEELLAISPILANIAASVDSDYI